MRPDVAAQKPEVQLRSAGGIQYELYRKKIKQLHLRVRDNGTVMVSIPLRTSLEQADAFVCKNAQWIHDTRQKVMEKMQHIMRIRYWSQTVNQRFCH